MVLFMIDGDAIRAARDAAEMRQEDLANTLGVTDVTIWRWESGRTKRLDYDTALRLANALGVSIDSLYVHEPEATEPSLADGTSKDHEAPDLTPSGSSRVDGVRAGAR